MAAYKLTIVSGPNRGSAYDVKDGETSIGRQTSNSVVLTSTKVSKKHCTLVVDNENITVRDEGSANGTFVNGVLTKSRHMNPGDRISVGEFVLELSSLSAKKQSGSSNVPKSLQGMGNVLQFPTTNIPNSTGASGMGGMAPSGYTQSIDTHMKQMPTDLKGKLLWSFEHKLMPIVYGMNLRYEWRGLALVGMILFMGLNLVVSVQPLMDAGKTMIEKESRMRAQYMAKEIVQRNTPFIAARQETKTEISEILKKEPGVKLALLIDNEGRILAPAERFNQYLAVGPEALFMKDMKKAFDEGRETGSWKKVDDDTVAAVEPVKIVNAQAGKNVIMGMAVVSVDTSLSVPSVGEIGLAYSQVLVISGLIGAFILFVLYKLTLRPFQVLNDDLDEALKGELHQVTHEYRIEELDSLWNNVNSALQRIPRKEVGASTGSQETVTADDFAAPIRGFAHRAKYGICVTDNEKKVIYMNPAFEDTTGIRFENAMGSDMATQARDQSFAALIHDLFDRVQMGQDGVSEDYEFSGVAYKLTVSAFGTSSGGIKARVMTLYKGDGG